MTIWELAIAAVMLLALLVYCLTGGADFGGGIWDLLARGPRAAKQRKLIAEAIAPIWEANHVWLIVLIVLLFSAFPKAFAAVSIALHIPLVIMLIGIVLRGSAFAFRSHEAAKGGWTTLFAVASTLTPFMLGVVLGAVSSGTIRVDAESGRVLTGFFHSWLQPFPLLIGALTVTLFAFLAAVYLTLETGDEALQDDFRRRALAAAVLVGVLAWLSFAVSGSGAPRLQQGLSGEWWAAPFHAAIGGLAVGAFVALWLRKYFLARFLAGGQVGGIVLGWGLSQYPYLVVPDLTIGNSGAADSVLRPIFFALLGGLLLVIPAFAYLYVIFKGEKLAAGEEETKGEGGVNNKP